MSRWFCFVSFDASKVVHHVNIDSVVLGTTGRAAHTRILKWARDAYDIGNAGRLAVEWDGFEGPITIATRNGHKPLCVGYYRLGYMPLVERLADRYSVTVNHVDTCQPDYLQDHHTRDGEALVGVSLSARKVTVGQIAAEVLSELDGHDDVPAVITSEVIDFAIRDNMRDAKAVFWRGWKGEGYPDESEDDCTYAWFLLTWDVDAVAEDMEAAA